MRSADSPATRIGRVEHSFTLRRVPRSRSSCFYHHLVGLSFATSTPMDDDILPPYSLVPTDPPPRHLPPPASLSGPPLPYEPPPPPPPAPLLNPTHFNVNGHWQSFVSTHQIVAHLKLLRAFKELKEKVEATAEGSWACFASAADEDDTGKGKGKSKGKQQQYSSSYLAPGSHTAYILQPGDAWRVFVSMAVHRFERFTDALKSNGEARLQRFLDVPLDVIMVWHAYALEPLYVSLPSARSTFLFVAGGLVIS